MSDRPQTSERATSEEPSPSFDQPQPSPRESEHINEPLSSRSLPSSPQTLPSTALNPSDEAQPYSLSSPFASTLSPTSGTSPDTTFPATTAAFEVSGGHQVGAPASGRPRRGKRKAEELLHHVMVRSSSSGSDFESDLSYPN